MNKNIDIISILNNRILQEVVIWLVILALLTISNTSLDLRLSVLLSVSVLSGMILLTLVNRLFFVPYLLEKKGMFIYLFASAILMSAIVFGVLEIEKNAVDFFYSLMSEETSSSPLDTQLPSESKTFFMSSGDYENGIFISERMKVIVLYLCMFLWNFVVYYMKKMQRQDDIKKSLEKEKTEMELRFLRSQINPHFLFNALNNIYSMVYMGDKNAPDSILCLSEMLRYVTDESSQNRIMLRDEVNYIENYINFQRYSYENSLNLTFEKHIELETAYLSPMLLEPFVENSFKYSGVGIMPDSFLKITLQTKGDELFFETLNSKGIKLKKGKTEREGVGMQNVKKRLELLYPNTHTLQIEEDDKIFKVSLHLQLEK